MFFELQGELVLDNNKETVVIIDKGDSEEYTHVYGTGKIVTKYLSSVYNIITIGLGCNLHNNYYELKRTRLKSLLRKVDNPDYIRLNDETIGASLLETFKDLPPVQHIVLSTDDMFRLPAMPFVTKSVNKELNEMGNEFFDYTGNDPAVLESIDHVNTYVARDWDHWCSPFAFSTQDTSLFMRVVDFINRTNRLKKSVIAFSIDPSIYTPFFDKRGIKSEFYYFADDTRGTRRFKKLGIAQIQHVVYDNQYKQTSISNWSDIEKTHNLIFAGTVFQTKGTRRFIWDEFLRNFSDDKSSFYIPLRKNGIIKPNNYRVKHLYKKLMEDCELSDLHNDVIHHPCFKGSLFPSELKHVLPRYKYGMVFRCISIHDSLNFRPVLYVTNGVLPLFDYRYDPEYLQVPKHIQDQLVVRCASDIVSKIQYFNANDHARTVLLDELREFFEINEYEENPDGMIRREIKKMIPEFA